ncbi:MAG: glycosyltransferase family 4 protein [Anaerolineae bacterium]|nr:glycosyltransferase family 4 protein [Anaerolineae bacterium]
MRVLMLSWEYPPHVVGGLGKHVADLVPALGRQGVEVHLLTPRWAGGPPEEPLEAGGRVYRLDPPPDTQGEDIHTTAWKTNLALEEKAHALWEALGGFDLIHVHDWLVAFAGGALKHGYKTPLLATIHATERGRGRGHLGSPVAQAIDRTEWWLTYEAWRVICCSEFMKGEIRAYFQVPEDKMDVIPNGVNLPPELPGGREALRHYRAMYALPEERIVVSVGRMVVEKGMHILLAAVPRILAAFPSAKFVLVGKGPMLDKLRQRAWELGVAEKVLFTGFIPDEERDRLYRLADCAVFPSLYEPFGIVALEAMAFRCPVVVSDVGGLREVVIHGETGITTYAGNPESLAWGIVHTLTHPEWTAQRVEAAYQRVRTEFNWDRIAQRTAAVYQRVVEERRRTPW